MHAMNEHTHPPAVIVMQSSKQEDKVLCENCGEHEMDTMTDDDVPLCYHCELATIDEMAMHEDTCPCVAAEPPHNASVDDCDCNLLGRIEQRKQWIQKTIALRDAMAGADLLHRTIRLLAAEFDVNWDRATAKANLDARAILLNCSNVIFAEHGMPITKDDIDRAQGQKCDTVKSE
jgi:hypothetical protein